MIEIKLTQDFPAGLDRLWSAFGREDYARDKCVALGAATVRTGRFNATAKAIDVELERDVPVDPSQLPTWARWSLGRLQTLQHRSAWRRAGPTRVTAELHITPVGLRVQAHGQGMITQTSASTSRMVLNWRVTSGLPFVGLKVERLFAELIRKSHDADHAFATQYLGEGGP